MKKAVFLGAVGGVSWGRRPGAPWAFHQIGPVPALSSPEREVVAAGVPGEGTGALSSPAASTITLLGTDRWVWRTRGGAHVGGQSRDPGLWGHSGSQVRWHLVTCETKQVLPPLYTVVPPDRSSPRPSGPHLPPSAWELQCFIAGPEASGLSLGGPSSCHPNLRVRGPGAC